MRSKSIFCSAKAAKAFCVVGGASASSPSDLIAMQSPEAEFPENGLRASGQNRRDK